MIKINDATSASERDYSKGKLYQWNGQEFLELEPTEVIKLPISEEAFEAVKAVRKEASRLVGARIELSMVASAMLLAAIGFDDMPERVKKYGARIFGS